VVVPDPLHVGITPAMQEYFDRKQMDGKRSAF